MTIVAAQRAVDQVLDGPPGPDGPAPRPPDLRPLAAYDRA